jgi:hypothetical protein
MNDVQIALDRDPHVLGAGMADRVVHGLLNDPIDGCLHVRAVPLGGEPHVCADLDVVAVADSGREALDGGSRPELVERGGAQFADQPAQAVDLLLEPLHRVRDPLAKELRIVAS